MSSNARAPLRIARPTLLRANVLIFGAFVWLTLRKGAEILLPDLFGTGAAGAALIAAIALTALGIPAIQETYSLRAKGLRNRLRLFAPTPAQVFFVLLAACVGLLFSDDCSLLACCALDGLGLNAGGALWRTATVTGGSPIVAIGLAIVIPILSEEFFFRGVLLSAWERRGTAYAVGATSALYALAGGSLAAVPLRFATGLALGWLVSCGGCWYLAPVYRIVLETLRFFAAQARAPRADSVARWTDLGASVGGGAGVAWLVLETVLLGAALALVVKVACSLRSAPGDGVRPRPVVFSNMGPTELFEIDAAVATGVILLLMDGCAIAGMWS